MLGMLFCAYNVGTEVVEIGESLGSLTRQFSLIGEHQNNGRVCLNRGGWNFLFLLSVYCVYAYACTTVHVCRLEDNLVESVLSSTTWVLGLELKLSGLVASTITQASTIAQDELSLGPWVAFFSMIPKIILWITLNMCTQMTAFMDVNTHTYAHKNSSLIIAAFY